MQTNTKSKWTCGLIGALALVMIIFNFNCGKKEDSNLKAQETTPEPLQSTKHVQTQANP